MQQSTLSAAIYQPQGMSPPLRGGHVAARDEPQCTPGDVQNARNAPRPLSPARAADPPQMDPNLTSSYKKRVGGAGAWRSQCPDAGAPISFPRTQTEAPASGTPLFGEVGFGTSFLHTTYCSTGHWSSSTVSRGGRLGPAPSTPTVAFVSTPHDSRGQRQCRRRPGHWPSRLCRAAWKPALSR